MCVIFSSLSTPPVSPTRLGDPTVILVSLLFPPRPAVCHADGDEAGQQNARMPEVPHQTHGPAGNGTIATLAPHTGRGHSELMHKSLERQLDNGAGPSTCCPMPPFCASQSIKRRLSLGIRSGFGIEVIRYLFDLAGCIWHFKSLDISLVSY